MVWGRESGPDASLGSHLINFLSHKSFTCGAAMETQERSQNVTVIVTLINPLKRGPLSHARHVLDMFPGLWSRQTPPAQPLPVVRDAGEGLLTDMIISPCS